jgi:RNA polymerase sigma factor (sigma-70 family)
MSLGPSDVALVRDAQRGDVASLGAVLGRYRARMHAVAVGILGHGPAAEDAVQDACVIAVRRIQELRDPAAAGAWLMKIVTNVSRSGLRRAAPVLVSEGDQSLDPPGVDDVERAIERIALRNWVWTALEGLSEPLRLVVMLRYFTDANSYQAIADICGVPVGTVRSRLNAAKSKLADELLDSAARAHLDSQDLDASHAALIGHAMAGFTRSGDRRRLEEAFSPDLAFVMFNRVERRGLDNYAAVLAHDMDDGVTARPVRVLTSSDTTVVEAWLDSPPETPLHCPPAITQVLHHPGGPVRRVVSHYAPRDPAQAAIHARSRPARLDP